MFEVAHPFLHILVQVHGIPLLALFHDVVLEHPQFSLHIHIVEQLLPDEECVFPPVFHGGTEVSGVPSEANEPLRHPFSHHGDDAFGLHGHLLFLYHRIQTRVVFSYEVSLHHLVEIRYVCLVGKHLCHEVAERGHAFSWCEERVEDGIRIGRDGECGPFDGCPVQFLLPPEDVVSLQESPEIVLLLVVEYGFLKKVQDGQPSMLVEIVVSESVIVKQSSCVEFEELVFDGHVVLTHLLYLLVHDLLDAVEVRQRGLLDIAEHDKPLVVLREEVTDESLCTYSCEHLCEPFSRPFLLRREFLHLAFIHLFEILQLLLVDACEQFLSARPFRFWREQQGAHLCNPSLSLHFVDEGVHLPETGRGDPEEPRHSALVSDEVENASHFRPYQYVVCLP